MGCRTLHDDSIFSPAVHAALCRIGLGPPTLLKIRAEKTIARVASGIYAVISQFQSGISVVDQTGINAYFRHVVKSEDAGLWRPHLSLMAEVSKGDCVGYVTSITLGQKVSVPARCSGKIIQMAQRKLVNTGSDLFAIGEEVADSRIS